MIANLEKSTGESFETWVERARMSRYEKHGEILNFLKTEHGLTYGYANLITLKSREKESGFGASSESLISAQYKGKEGLLPLFNQLISEITKLGGDVSVAPKKTYVSLRRKKQFALIQPSTRTRLDIGINLKNEAITDRLENSGSFNAMCSHRVRIEHAEQIDKEFLQWIKAAYEKA